MHRRRFLITTCVVLAIVLTSCARAGPDWQVAQQEADVFSEAFAADPNAIATGYFRAGPSEPVPEDEPALGFEFASTVRIDEIRVACFGGGQAVFGAISRSTSTWVGIGSVTVPCDGETQSIPLDTPREQVDAVDITGRIESGGGAVLASVIIGAEE